MAEGERGSVTAEFAMVLPAVILVLACCLASVQLAGQQVRLQDAAADAARAISRGDSAGAAASRAAAAVPGATLATSTRGDMVCAHLTTRSSSPLGTILGVRLSASSCALGGGR